MDGFMSIEALSYEALYGALHRRFVSERDLVLHNDMNHRVHLFIWKPDTRTSVIALRKVNALSFIDREPFFRLRRLKGIVLYSVLHRGGPCTQTCCS